MTLEEFVDEGIRRARAVGYHPTTFMSMWANDRSTKPIEKLVISSEPKSGYQRMVTAGLKDWTLESAVVKFPHLFSREAKAYAQARLDGKLDA